VIGGQLRLRSLCEITFDEDLRSRPFESPLSADLRISGSNKYDILRHQLTTGVKRASFEPAHFLSLAVKMRTAST